MAPMEVRPWFAASGALALHVLVIAAALSIAGPRAMREFVRPVQVALLEAPKPEPPKPEPPKPEPPKPEPEPPRAEPPRPLPVQATPPRRVPAPKVAVPRPVPRKRADPPPAPPPEPARPVVPAAPIEAPRPAAITAAPAPVAHTAPRFDASWAGNTPPAYPAMARRLGEEGEVRLDVQVGPQGKVLEVRLKKSSGSTLLDQTAIETVKRWRFSPATVDGKPVAEWYYDWKWVFKLEG